MTEPGPSGRAQSHGPTRRGVVAGLALATLLLGGVRERAWALAAHERPGTPFAVITHPDTPVTDLSLSTLRRVFLGEQQFWSGGGRVVLFVNAPGTSARAVVLRHLYQMSEPAFKRYWIAKTFRDDVAAGPKIVTSSALARRLTATIPGAVAVIPASEVDATIRVLSVDGRLPGTDGYPLLGQTGTAP